MSDPPPSASHLIFENMAVVAVVVAEVVAVEEAEVVAEELAVVVAVVISQL